MKSPFEMMAGTFLKSLDFEKIMKRPDISEALLQIKAICDDFRIIKETQQAQMDLICKMKRRLDNFENRVKFEPTITDTWKSKGAENG